MNFKTKLIQYLVDHLRPAKGLTFIILAPNSAFPSMISAPAIIGKILADLGHRVEFLSCDANRKTCTVMDGLAPLEERPFKNFCGTCMDRAAEYLTQYQLSFHSRRAFMRDSDCPEMQKDYNNIENDPRNFVLDGIHIGALTTGNLSAILKKDLFSEISDSELARLRIMVKDGVDWYYVAKNAYSSIKPTNILYYAEYYPEIIFGQVMQNFGVTVKPIVHSSLNGNDFRKIQIINEMPQVIEMSRRLPDWPKWRDLALRPNQVKEISDDIVTKLLAKSMICFSPAIGGESEISHLRNVLDDRLRTIVVFPSSDDELNNTKKQREIFNVPVDTSGEIFSDQSHWLSEIAKYVKYSKDHQMIVRMHPRMAPNSRSNAAAKYNSQLDPLLEVNCERIHVIRPEAQVSSYEVAQLADIVLTSWSSMGLECVRLGLPVVMAFRGADIFPSSGFLRFTDTRTQYFNNLDDIPNAELDHLIHAFRYTFMFMCAGAFDFSEMIAAFDDPTLPPFKMPSFAKQIEACAVGNSRVDLINLTKQQSHQGPDARLEELRAISAAIRRIVYVLSFNSDFSPRDLIESEKLLEEQGSIGDPSALHVQRYGGHFVIICNGNVARRQSSVIENLLRMHQQIRDLLEDDIILPEMFENVGALS